MNNQLNTPVALIFFTRPDTLKKVFEEVRKAKPRQLFLIQDGPREGRPDDTKKILECRKIVENIDWDCEIFKNYSETNLGCGKRPSSGISWVFSHVDKAIILEDDCVPCETFFPYCEEMLQYYENDERISYISGLNHFSEWDCGKYSYFFTKTGAIWGWATWKRAWDKYDFYVDAINDDYARKILHSQITSKFIAEQRIKRWEYINAQKNKQTKLSYWDFQWGFVKYIQNQLVIVPKYNQISNIGNGLDSTHALKVSAKKANKKTSFFYIPTKKLELPLQHPNFCCCDKEYDSKFYSYIQENPFTYFAKKILKKLFKNCKKTNN